MTSDRTCTTCGNTYDKAFTVTLADGTSAVYDSLECAATGMAPVCPVCSTRILGHGVESDEGIFCCAHCAARAGEERLTDRV